ncbi:hypothetical protein Salat_2195900 [Sesamum alatum]|uniref:Uncharacterized protein n=1 Tax=Sesamum alatum TaxID=300844 RepID=A0AAE1XTT9_9LAMI|nr:hypothetical protein Salat_2195900 [Sesamum alatum]
MVRVYDGVDVPVVIYVEEVCDPLLVIDTQGNILPNIMAGGDKDAEMNLLMSDIDFTDDYESVATQQFRNEDNMGENEMGEGNIQQETENTRNEGDTDSSDADYTQPQWTDEEDTDDEPGSDQNSLVYEDIEASSDEDIFLEKNLSKRQMMMKLRKKLKQKSKQKNISHDAGPRNDALLGNKVGKNQEATTGSREANGVVPGPREANPTVVNRRSKKPTVAEVLRNIRHRSLEKRAKQF